MTDNTIVAKKAPNNKTRTTHSCPVDTPVIEEKLPKCPEEKDYNSSSTDDAVNREKNWNNSRSFFTLQFMLYSSWKLEMHFTASVSRKTPKPTTIARD
jgi:hypothetical protein